MTKHSLHLSKLDSLAVGESYIIECQKKDIQRYMAIHKRKTFYAQGKLFSSNSFTAIPPSTVKEHIYIIKYVRKY